MSTRDRDSQRDDLVRTVRIPAGTQRLEGELIIPVDARGVVVFAHGSGSSRHSRRNRRVASVLRARAAVGTLLMDLLPPEETDEWTREYCCDVEILAERLVRAVSWLTGEPATRGLDVGLFGASAGAGAALLAASRLPQFIHAVVSRGGRPDLTDDALAAVRAPTLLIVGSDDEAVVDLNLDALGRLPETSTIELLAGATHLFEEPGALDEVARLAASWFARHLSTSVESLERRLGWGENPSSGPPIATR